MAKQKPKNSAIVTLLFTNFFNVFGWALLTPLYALYATHLGGTPQEVTLTWSFYSLLAGILIMLLGWLEDRLPNKHYLLRAGYIVETAGLVVLYMAHDLRLLLAGLGIYAIGMGIVTPIWKLLYAKRAHKGKEATEWGIFHGVNTLLISGAAASSGVLYVICGFRGIISLMAACHGFSFLISLRVKNVAV